MPVYSDTGSANKEIGAVYADNGSANLQVKEIYADSGTANRLIYQSQTDFYPGQTHGKFLGRDKSGGRRLGAGVHLGGSDAHPDAENQLLLQRAAVYSAFHRGMHKF